MASKYDKENEQDLMEEDDGIRPEDSASNVSAPTSMTSSMARQLQIERVAAANKLKIIEEEAALLKMERELEMKTVHDERELRRKRREAKIEAQLKAAQIKAEKKEMEARIRAKKRKWRQELKRKEKLKNWRRKNH